MNTKILITYITQFEQETNLESRIKLLNAMIDVVKKEIWSLTGQMIRNCQKP